MSAEAFSLALPELALAVFAFSFAPAEAFGAGADAAAVQGKDIRLIGGVLRNVNLSDPAFLAILGLVLFGGEVIRGFTLSMLVGVFVGTYSSIYVAGPMLIYFKLRPDTFDKDKDKDSKNKSASDAAPTPAT